MAKFHINRLKFTNYTTNVTNHEDVGSILVLGKRVAIKLKLKLKGAKNIFFEMFVSVIKNAYAIQPSLPDLTISSPRSTMSLSSSIMLGGLKHARRPTNSLINTLHNRQILYSNSMVEHRQLLSKSCVWNGYRCYCIGRKARDEHMGEGCVNMLSNV